MTGRLPQSSWVGCHISNSGSIPSSFFQGEDMTFSGCDKSEPSWLIKMRQVTKQCLKICFVKIRWIELQHLLCERDALWQAAIPVTRDRLLALRKNDD